LGQNSNEKHPAPSLKVADLSINVSKQIKEAADLLPKFLGICDDLSFMTRFNDERNWVEWMLTRNLPGGRRMALSIDAVIKGVHSPSIYNQLEAAYDGIIDFKLEDIGGKTADLMRIRSMRNARFESNWHQLKVMENLMVGLEK
jgi:KaiC/GvpD/RAD55 family RecA-like ATPase